MRTDSAELALQSQQVGPPGAVSPRPGPASYVPVGGVAVSCGVGFTCGRMSRLPGSLGPWKLGPGVILERVRVLSETGPGTWNRPGRCAYCVPPRELLDGAVALGRSPSVWRLPVCGWTSSQRRCLGPRGVVLLRVVPVVLRVSECLESESEAIGGLGPLGLDGGPVRRAAPVDRRWCLLWSTVGPLVGAGSVVVRQRVGDLAVSVPERDRDVRLTGQAGCWSSGVPGKQVPKPPGRSTRAANRDL